MKCFKQFLLAFLLSIVGSVNAATAAERPIEVITFPGGFNWPLWVAQEKGFFAANGIAVKVTPTPSSVFQLTQLIDGRFDIAMTAMDNLVAYREGQGEAPVVGRDLIAVMGGDRGFLKLVSAPPINSVSALRGEAVSVDARNTGYSLVLFELLDRAGLHEPEFTVERAGGVLQRFQSLLQGKQAATLLVSPFELQAQAHGFNVIAKVSTDLGAYQGMVAGVRRAWAETHRAQLEGFISAYAKSVEWLYNPTNKQEALRIFTKYMPNSDLAMAEAAFPLLVNEQTGFQRRAELELPGLDEVLRLRAKWGIPQKKLGIPEKYYDPRFYNDALKYRRSNGSQR